MIAGELDALFDAVDCEGWLCVLPIDGQGDVSLRADEVVVSASVSKVSIALEAQCQIESGELDPHERVRLTAGSRTPGPTGFSTFSDDVDVSLRDLVRVMLTISDNAATDAVLARAGLNRVNARMAQLGLVQTVIVSDFHTLIDSIGQEAGWADWAEMVSQDPANFSREEVAAGEERIRACNAVRQPHLTTRTTAREMARLMRLIWRDEAGPAAACGRVRQDMAHQLTRHRLASAFDAGVQVAAKSGGLIGIIRNEVGVISYPSGARYAAAVFTRAHSAGRGEPAINAAIGAAAAAAIGVLESTTPGRPCHSGSAN
jgi:beta-lactamase class A